jgi:hypothetical protein
MKQNQGFNASAYQVRIGYKYFRNKELPGDLPFSEAGNGLVQDYGLLRVQAVVQGIPNAPEQTEFEALARAKAADPEARGA